MAPTFRIGSIVSKGAKYYITGDVERRATTFFSDSGADVSILPRRFAPSAPLLKLPYLVRIGGFSAASKPVLVTHKVEVTLNFHPGEVKTSFYVCETAIPIIGNDFLRNKELRLSLCTGKELFSIHQHVINTKTTPASSRKEYIRRCKMGEVTYAREMGNPFQSASWMRALQECRRRFCHHNR